MGSSLLASLGASVYGAVLLYRRLSCGRLGRLVSYFGYPRVSAVGTFTCQRRQVGTSVVGGSVPSALPARDTTQGLPGLRDLRETEGVCKCLRGRNHFLPSDSRQSACASGWRQCVIDMPGAVC